MFKERLLVSSIALGSLLQPAASFASGIPTGDGMNFGAKMMHMVQDQMDNAKEMAAEEAKRQLMSQLGDNNVSAIENSTAESIVRITDSDTAIYNQDLARANQPPSNSCSIYNSAKAAKNSASAREVAMINGQAEFLDYDTRDRLGASNLTNKTLRERSAQAIADRLKENVNSGAALEQIKVANIMRPQGIPSFANSKQKEDQNDFIRLAIGHAPNTGLARGESLEDVASWAPERVADFLSQTLHKNIAYSAFDYVRNVNTSSESDNASVAETIRHFNNNHWLNADWVAHISNVKKGENGSTQVEEVIRSLTAISAFSAWLDSNRYEISQYQLLVDGSILAKSLGK